MSPETVTGATVEGAEHRHALGHAGGDCHHRLVQAAGGGTASVMGASPERDVAAAQGAGHLDLVVAVQGEGGEAVDGAGVQPGVVTGRFDRLCRQGEF